MGTTSGTQQSMDEIVFENRNKAYGAYYIRRSYDASLIKSFILAMMALLVLIGLYQLVPQAKTAEEAIITSVEGRLVNLDPGVDPPPIQKQHIDPPHRTPDEHAATVFVDTTIKTEPVNAKPDPGTATGDSGPETASGKGNGTEEKEGPGVTALPEPEPVPTFFPDSMPEFPGGENALRKYLGKNIDFNGMARDAGIQGNLVIRFVIDQNGNVKDVSVLKKLGYGLDEQASAVIQKMPRWKPGKIKGKAVPVYYTQPVKYSLMQ